MSILKACSLVPELLIDAPEEIQKQKFQSRLNDAVVRAQSVRDKLNAEQAAALEAWTEKHANEKA